MISGVQRLLDAHALSFVLTAAVICSVVAAIVVSLLARASNPTGASRKLWMLLTAVVLGVGVWTTHFVGILGYRPDAALGYEPIATLLSALVSVVFVGVPIAVTVLARRQWIKAALGALGGVGVGAMHFTGMSALQGSVVTFDVFTSAVAILSVMTAFAVAMNFGKTRSGRLLRGILFVMGVLSLHFTAMSGLTLDLLPVTNPWTVDRFTLSVLVACALLLLSLAAMFAASADARLHAAGTVAAAAEARQFGILSASLNNMSNGLVMVDADGRIGLFNERVIELLKLDAGDIFVGMPLSTYLANIGRHHGWDEDRIARVVARHAMWRAKQVTTRAEHYFDQGMVLSIACRPTVAGGCILTYEDVTDFRSAVAKVQHMAHHDALTGLPNRSGFVEHLQRLLRNRPRVSMLMLDLDRFKAVNDTLGHPVGDALLIEVAARLRQNCRPSDLIFRLGGDEFAVLPQPDVGRSADDLAHRIILAFAKPFCINGHTIGIGCSVGIAMSEPGIDHTEMVQMADLALDRAKELGRNRAEHYEPGMIEAARHRRQTEIDMARALRNGEFELFYQPFRSLPENRLLGFEALIRWNHPSRGTVAPAEFIPLAEANGMICQIGEWVLNEACRTVVSWPDHLFVAVNVSAVQLRTPGFSALVARTLLHHGLAASKLELELTETAMVVDGLQIAEVLRELRALGVRIAMDDFGTGCSSLTHLRDFVLDRIKIDRSFIGTTSADIGARAVVRAVTGMARDLSITTIAEGVETQEQLARLTELGCDAVQGYLLGKPMNASEATRTIAVEPIYDDVPDGHNLPSVA